MISGIAIPHLNDPDFQDALTSFQNGVWDQGFTKLDRLIQQYPSMTELRDFRQEMLVRSRIDDYEREETKREIGRKIVFWGSRVTAIVVVVLLLGWAVNSFSAGLQEQWSNVSSSVIEDVQTLDLAVKYKDAQNYISAGRPEEALSVLDQIAVQDPDYPGVAELQTSARQMAEFEGQYQHGLVLMESGDFIAALSTFEEIQDQQPGYKDVPVHIQEIEKTLILEDLYTQAEEAYFDEDWDGAILRYEGLRVEAPKYKPEEVEERLIKSYINAANLVLADEVPSSDSLIAADRYFRKALVLRPLDKEILADQDQALSKFKERLFISYLEKARETLIDNEDSLEALKVANSYFDLALYIKPGDEDVLYERQMTSAYLNGQNNFLQNDWDAVIDNLEYVFERDNDYANGTTRQTLYDSYMKRGKKLISNGEYESAIEDFQRASELAGESPDARLQVYWSLIEMGDVYGILGEYQKADSLYAHAVEWIGLHDILESDHPNLVVLLNEADRYAGIEWFRTSYRLYKRVLPAGDLIYSAVTHEVTEGEYLTKIAGRYRTTVEAILSANELSNPGDIQTGQRILIPVLSADQD